MERPSRDQLKRAYEWINAQEGMEVTWDTLRRRVSDAYPILIQLAQESEPGDEEKTARERPTTQYGKLADQVESNATYMSKVLVTIDKICAKNGDPPVSPLVERANVAGPGHEYFDWGHLVDDRVDIDSDTPGLPDEAKDEWRRKLREAYEHDGWSIAG